MCLVISEMEEGATETHTENRHHVVRDREQSREKRERERQTAGDKSGENRGGKQVETRGWAGRGEISQSRGGEHKGTQPGPPLPHSRHRPLSQGWLEAAAEAATACQALFPAHHIRPRPGWGKGKGRAMSAMNHPVFPKSA